MRFDDEPPLWRDMWKPVELSDRVELFLTLVVLFFPVVLVIRWAFS